MLHLKLPRKNIHHVFKEKTTTYHFLLIYFWRLCCNCEESLCLQKLMFLDAIASLTHTPGESLASLLVHLWHEKDCFPLWCKKCVTDQPTDSPKQVFIVMRKSVFYRFLDCGQFEHLFMIKNCLNIHTLDGYGYKPTTTTTTTTYPLWARFEKQRIVYKV